MFTLFKNKSASQHQQITVKIDGMHCSSCSLNIDSALEDLDGVVNAKTSYAKSTTKVTFQKEKATKEQILKVIKEVGYAAHVLD